MIKIAHFGDLHACEKTKEESLKALNFIFDECRNREVDFILNSGDTFDGAIMLGDKGPETGIFNEIVELLCNAPAPLYVIQGTPSHDIPGSLDVFDDLSGRHTIKVFKRPDSFPLIRSNSEQPYAHISFLPALSKNYFVKDKNLSLEESNQLIAENMRPILADFGAKASENPKPHILMAHFEVTGAVYSNKQTILGGDIKLSTANIALARADYVAMGHIHKCQKIGPNIYYAGSPYHLNFGELEEKGFNIVTFDDKGNLEDVEFVKNPHARPRQTIEAHFNPETRGWDLSEQPHPGADVRIRLYAPMHELKVAFNLRHLEEIHNDVKTAVLEAGIHSVKLEKIPTAEYQIRATEIASAKSLREEFLEWGRVKEIGISESVLVKVDKLEEETVITSEAEE